MVGWRFGESTGTDSTVLAGLLLGWFVVWLACWLDGWRRGWLAVSGLAGSLAGSLADGVVDAADGVGPVGDWVELGVIVVVLSDKVESDFGCLA